jgi:GT2 family glycosyltransferase
MKLSIVVGTYNRKDQIRACVESIVAETKMPHIIYITDGGSTDGTVDYLKSIASETVRPFFVGKLIGQAKAYNDVFFQVTTPYVCWLSDDNIVVSSGLDIAVRALEQNQRIGMIGLKIKDMRGPFTDAPYIGGISVLGILNVNQGVLRTNVLQEVGGFSEVFKNYGIDPDLTAKVLFSGYDVAYTRPVALHHYRNWSTDRSSPEYVDLAKKQEHSLRLYESKYSRWMNSPGLVTRTKRRLLRLAKERSGNPQLIHSKKHFMGSLPRDWFNVLNGRYISLFDSLRCSGRDYHLLQRCPKKLLPDSLPPDPRDA